MNPLTVFTKPMIEMSILDRLIAIAEIGLIIGVVFAGVVIAEKIYMRFNYYDFSSRKWKGRK